MPRLPSAHEIYLEIGRKRVFAGSVHWPGWCCQGHDEESAIRALLEAGPRYAQVTQWADLSIGLPATPQSFSVVERVAGNATTDFGAPAMPISSDSDLVDAGELARFQALLRAVWEAFDRAVERAKGQELRKGPRGGGRDLAGIVSHVVDADLSYLKRLGWDFDYSTEHSVEQMIVQFRLASLDGLEASAAGRLPLEGPRGGRRWPARYFVRRVAWHTIDHAWEIEDRVLREG